MIVFRYDHTFEGLLSALFDAYLRKRFPDRLLAPADPLPLFCDEVYDICTDAGKAERVWAALRRKLSRHAIASLAACWLSELPQAPSLLFRYMRKAVDAPRFAETDFADPDILAVHQLAKKVNDERHRILQFMRFQKTAEGIYFGVMEPLYNVLSLTVDHFRDRFSDQPWLIYDTRRSFGYYYDGSQVEEITFTDPRQTHLLTGKLDESLLNEDEKLFQTLWKSYFKAICIKNRLNPRKHRKDMPVRYWKFLTEKD